jgi:hypothetical protein
MSKKLFFSRFQLMAILLVVVTASCGLTAIRFITLSSPSTTLTISSGDYQASSYTFYFANGTYYGEDANGGQIIPAGSINASYVLNSIISIASQGATIIVNDGIYFFTSGIIASKNVYLRGESMGAFDDFTSGTVLKYVGAASSVFIDARDNRFLQISDLKIINAGGASAGLRLGGSVVASTLATKCIYLKNLVIDGFATGILGDVQGPDDSNYDNLFVGNCTIAIDHMSSQSKFIGGAFYDTDIGVRVYRGTTPHPDASMQFYGTVWSGATTTAIDIIGNQSVRALTFVGCWFETVAMILRTTRAQGGIFLGSIDFINCNGYPTDTVFDLSGRNINVIWDGGELYPSSYPAFVYTDGVGSTSQHVRIAHLSAGSERISFHDDNNGLRGIDNSEYIMLNDFLGANSLVTSASWTNTFQNMPCLWSANSTTTCTLIVKWTPGSTNAGIRVRYGASIIASIEPESAAYRADLIDISANARTLMDYGGDIVIQCHGNGSIAPTVNLIQFLYSY